jgi:UDP-glucose 4-epimerase
MNIFISGGAGYIGSAAAEILRDAGHNVTVYDSLVTGHRAAVPEGVRFIEADLSQTDVLRQSLVSGSFEAAMHFAGFIEAGESMRDAGKYFHNNVALSISFIEACLQSGVERFVFSSSAAVYASSDEPLSEDSPLGPASVYGQTKLMIEQALEWYRRVHGLRYTALRYFNASGALPGRGEAHDPESHLIPLALKVALDQRSEVKIFGTDYPTNDGTTIRDYIHIADLIDAHLLALDALKEQDQLVYNIGNGAGYSVREVIETARKVTDHPLPAIDSPRRAGDASRLVASADKIRRELGWQPKFPDLEQIIASAWKWHSSHPHGYD